MIRNALTCTLQATAKKLNGGLKEAQCLNSSERLCVFTDQKKEMNKKTKKIISDEVVL